MDTAQCLWLIRSSSYGSNSRLAARTRASCIRTTLPDQVVCNNVTELSEIYLLRTGVLTGVMGPNPISSRSKRGLPVIESLRNDQRSHGLEPKLEHATETGIRRAFRQSYQWGAALSASATGISDPKVHLRRWNGLPVSSVRPCFSADQLRNGRLKASGTGCPAYLISLP